METKAEYKIEPKGTGVGIVGFGYVGRRVYSQLKDRLRESMRVYAYDLVESADAASMDSFNDVELDVCFFCLPSFANVNEIGEKTHGADLAELEKLVRISTAGLKVICTTVDLEFCDRLSDCSEVVYFPERVNPSVFVDGAVQDSVARVLGGYSMSTVERARNWLACNTGGQVLPVVASSAKAAVLSKLIENSYRLINIAFINELATARETRQYVAEAVELAATKPFGFEAFRPSLKAGGHCIPEDPAFLMKFSPVLSESIWSNEQNPYSAAKVFIDDAKSVKRAIVLGRAYKKNSTIESNSGPVEFAKALQQERPEVKVETFDCTPDDTEKLEAMVRRVTKLGVSDVVVIGQRHDHFEPLVKAIKANKHLRVYDPTYQLFSPRSIHAVKGCSACGEDHPVAAKVSPWGLESFECSGVPVIVQETQDEPTQVVCCDCALCRGHKRERARLSAQSLLDELERVEGEAKAAGWQMPDEPDPEEWREHLRNGSELIFKAIDSIGRKQGERGGGG